MKLREKFGLLALIYIVSLAGNFVLCAWCIFLYYEALRQDFGDQTARAAMISESATDDQINTAPSRPAATERTILGILALNGILGGGLGLLGMVFVQRWVVRPVADLRETTRHIARGDWSFRATPRSGDELGLLACEVNDMTTHLTEMQARLLEQERHSMVSETLRNIVHNIRSPLTGIRWLAEVMAVRLAADPAASRGEERIVAIVDELMARLKSFRERSGDSWPTS